MRTKALLCAAALAAGALSSMAQSNVYSLNVVGYVNKTFKNGAFTLVGNPLDNGTNDLQTIFSGVPDNTIVYTWNNATQDLGTTTPTYSASQSKWIPNLTISPGQSFFVASGGDFTNTFVGNVNQTAQSVVINGNGNFQAVASLAPVGGSLTNALAGYAATDGDTVYTWNVTTQDFDGQIPTWSASQSKWIPDANIPVGDGFFLVRAGGPVTYTRTFTVQ